MNPEGDAGQPRGGKSREAVLWVVAAVLMLAAAGYQRHTGPSYPTTGDFEVDGRSFEYALIRNELTSRDAKVAIADPGGGISGTLFYKRYRTADDFTAVGLANIDGELVAWIPAQPAAGKVEYFLILDTPAGRVPVPDELSGNVVIRFKDPVPLHVLLPHILSMFIAMLIGVRAGLAAVFSPGSMRRLVWIGLAVMTVGGLVLGPIAQKYAFGAYWTGFPFDYDLTDNKVLIMWLVWLTACAVVGFEPRRSEGWARLAVVLAALVMVGVYIIPHSARGTELDYELLEQGVPPSEALKSGRQGS
ncbi:MAG: hypothetical protein AMS21_02565 [Gemmatimonas sp. SG8_38_2]|nr:MAG: hypothetical protein AMS21_02565 [Gemmatimonas sp. SG8_38_2]